MLNFRPWLTLIATMGIVTAVLYFGFPVEQAIISATGFDWVDSLADISSLWVVFPAMLLAALVAGRLTGINVLEPGQDASRAARYGLLLGLALVVLAVGMSFLVGSAAMASSPPRFNFAAIAFASLAFLIVAVAEEALFRGWAQPMVARFWGPIIAVGVTSVAFAFGHSAFFQTLAPVTIDLMRGDITQAIAAETLDGTFREMSLVVTLNLFLGGAVMGLLALRHRGIAAPVMFHFGWNWADYFLFALTPNPGKFSFGSVVDVDLSGSAQIGGVVDGMMANIFATLILLAMAIALFVILRRGGQASKTPAQPAKPPSAPIRKDAGNAPAAPMALVKEPDLVPNQTEAAAEPPAVVAVGSAPPESGATTSEAPVSAIVAEGAAAVQFATHQGCVRELNEDRFLTNEESGVFIVADGMGGHKFGDRASTMIVDHVASAAIGNALDEKVASVSDAIRAANNAIFEEAQGNGSRMGSTVVGLAIKDNQFAVFWAGDSRAYRLRDGDVERLTKDHTQVQEMVDRGLLKAEDASRHPMSHVLVRAVGVSLDFEIEESRGEILPGDVFFLCSDGIYDVLEDDEIATLLAKSHKIDAMEKMIGMALDLGARDNVTGIIVRPTLAG